jgi:hypothetical protein
VSKIAAVAFENGLSDPQIADGLGLSRRSVQRWRTDPDREVGSTQLFVRQKQEGLRRAYISVEQEAAFTDFVNDNYPVQSGRDSRPLRGTFDYNYLVFVTYLMSKRERLDLVMSFSAWLPRMKKCSQPTRFSKLQTTDPNLQINKKAHGEGSWGRARPGRAETSAHARGTRTRV